MKAVFKFDLPDDVGEYRDHVNATDYGTCLREIDEYLRRAIKNGTEFTTIEEFAEHVRGIICVELWL